QHVCPFDTEAKRYDETSAKATKSSTRRPESRRSLAALEDLAGLRDTARDDEGCGEEGRHRQELRPADRVGSDGDDERHHPGEQEDDQLGGRRGGNGVVPAVVA